MLLTLPFQDYGLLLLRIIVGAIFIVHGWSKIKAKSGKFFVFLGAAETLGGIASVLGFLTQFANIGFLIIMLSAIYMKEFKWNVKFVEQEKMGWEFDAIILAATVILIILGAGSLSNSFPPFLHNDCKSDYS